MSDSIEHAHPSTEHRVLPHPLGGPLWAAAQRASLSPESLTDQLHPQHAHRVAQWSGFAHACSIVYAPCIQMRHEQACPTCCAHQDKLLQHLQESKVPEKFKQQGRTHNACRNLQVLTVMCQPVIPHPSTVAATSHAQPHPSSTHQLVPRQPA